MDIPRQHFEGDAYAMGDECVQQTQPVIRMVVGVPLIVGDVAEQMVVVELAHDKLIRLVLIVYVGKDT